MVNLPTIPILIVVEVKLGIKKIKIIKKSIPMPTLITIMALNLIIKA